MLTTDAIEIWSNSPCGMMAPEMPDTLPSVAKDNATAPLLAPAEVLFRPMAIPVLLVPVGAREVIVPVP